MTTPTITITIDPIKGTQMECRGLTGEAVYLLLTGLANQTLIQLLATKQTNLVQTPNGNGRPTLVS